MAQRAYIESDFLNVEYGKTYPAGGAVYGSEGAEREDPESADFKDPGAPAGRG